MSSITGDVEPAPKSPESLAAYVAARLEHRLLDRLVAYDQLTITVEPSAVPMAAQLCRDDPELGFDFFDFLTAVDEREDGFGVVIHLYSTRHRHHIQIRAVAEGGREAPSLPTISHLYAGANWHERECWEMFGIAFEGHPGLRHLYLPGAFEGNPLRKDYPLLARRMKPWPGIVDVELMPGEEEGDEAAEEGSE